MAHRARKRGKGRRKDEEGMKEEERESAGERRGNVRGKEGRSTPALLTESLTDKWQ